ncbi:relaxin receptor 1-like [Hemicordylus capensis]|uniref:relaxin receptor 1-like n=1 Tax=Hemicordylus capensis TaxID=884348 RepID=UPI002304AEEE|nr:relaxin receptor 1-like [Hemicordylus capensis]
MGLKSLVYLNLHKNSLQAMPNASVCAEMPVLDWLDLEENQFQALQSSDFQGCSQLSVLVLNRNKIKQIQKGTFSRLSGLVDLDLSSNRIQELLPSAFVGLHKLRQLNISNNPLHQIFLDEFDSMPLLQSLSLEGLEIPNIHSRMFEKLRFLSHIYFKKFRYCSFAPHVRKCKPNTDGISSLENLLANIILRVFVWVIAFITCFGNLFVIFMRSFVVTENSKHTMAIKSLCCADCLMGVYLFCLGTFDLMFAGEYNKHAQAWMASVSCQLVGSLAMLSSEVSVLLLTYMTLQKYLCIVFPFSRYGASKKRTRCILVLIWVLGFVLTLVPFLCLESFRKFYGANGVCFPLHSDGTESQSARRYSTGIFLGVNLVAFVTIVFAYTSMFFSIHTTAARTAERSVFSMEVAVAKRFFFIVLTNALCWIPIFLLKTFFLLEMEIPGSVTSWLVIFILPINSALNPILYTITTTSFREKLKQCLETNRTSLQETQGKSFLLLSTHTTTV